MTQSSLFQQEKYSRPVEFRSTAVLVVRRADDQSCGTLPLKTAMRPTQMKSEITRQISDVTGSFFASTNLATGRLKGNRDGVDARKAVPGSNKKRWSRLSASRLEVRAWRLGPIRLLD